MRRLLFDQPARGRASRYQPWLHALLAKFRRSVQRAAGTESLTRIEDYANGARRLTAGVVGTELHDHWPHVRDVVEHALDLALVINRLGFRARSLRSHGGRVGHRIVQCWEIPAPHGPVVLESLVGILPGLDLPATLVADD